MSTYLFFFILTVGLTLVLARLAPAIKLIAMPGEHRQHSEPTPLVGGIALAFSLFTAEWLGLISFDGLFWSLLLIFAVGVLDDYLHLPSWLRFAVQGVSIWLMVIYANVQLDTLGWLTARAEVLTGDGALAMTIFASIGVINAVNMSDGMDGQAGSLVFLALAALLVLGADYALISTIMACVLGFLIFNLRIGRAQAAVFLGDAGSTMLGLLLAYLLIDYSQGPSALFAPVTALWILALPLFDAVTVLLLRPLRGSSPFTADRSHYHHLLLQRGLNVNQTLAVIVLVQCTLIGLGLTLAQQSVAEHLQLALFLAVFLAYMGLVWSCSRRDRREQLV